MSGKRHDYTGPQWVGPFFKWLIILALAAYALGFTYEVEWEDA